MRAVMNVLYFQVSKHPFLPEGMRSFSTTVSTRGQGRWRQFQSFRLGAKPHVADGIPINHKLIFQSSLRRYAIAGYTALVFTVPAYIAYISYALTDKDYIKKEAMKRQQKQQAFTWKTVDEFYQFTILLGILLVVFGFGWLKIYRITLFRIYHNEKDGLYTAVRRNNFFRIQRIEFSSKDVQEVETRKRSLCNVKIKGTGYLVPLDSFVSAAAFNKFMNYKARWDVGGESNDRSLRERRSKLRK